MSLKPPKKSDLNKGWMKKRLDREIRIQPEYHLIVTEGTNTEPQYFQAIKDIVNQQYREKIQLAFMVKGIIHSACLKKPEIGRVKTRTGISMFGWFMIRMISRQITLTVPQSYVSRTRQMRHSTMRCGQTSV